MSVDRIVQTVLSKAPHWMLDVIEKMVQHDGALVRWLKARAAAGLPVPEPAVPVVTAATRLLIAPFNYAGQAHEWARALEQSDATISAQNLAVVFPKDYGFPASARVPAAVFAGSQEWRRKQEDAYAGYSHVILESFTSSLGRGRGRGVEREIQWHLGCGRKVALLCHGTDIRSPKAHRERSSYSPFAEMDHANERLERRVVENRRVMRATGLPVFYSTPDLIHDVPEGVWLPLVVNPARWEQAAASVGVNPSERAVPVVLHAPTNAKIKGTAAVEAAVEALGSAIEYLPLAGIQAADMPNHVAAADIVVDQLLLGSYGVAACEAMAAGRVVIGNVDEEVRRAVRDRFGLDLPIVQADPDTIMPVLAKLAADPEERERAANLGPRFVREVHSGAQTLETLHEFLR